MTVLRRLWLAPAVAEACVALLIARRRVLGADGDRVLAGLPLRRAADRVVTRGMEHQARRVKRALAAARRRLPCECSCLVQLLAAAWMLRRRGVSAQLFVGVRPGSPDGLEAHAWVEVGQTTVCGGAARHLFKVLSVHGLQPHG